MKINLLNTIRISKPEILKSHIVKVPQALQFSACDKYTFINATPKTMDSIINEICGTFSKDDLEQIAVYIKGFFNSVDLTTERDSIVENVQSTINNLFSKSKEDEKKLLFIPEKLTTEIKTGIRDQLLKLYAIKNINNKEKEFISPIPFSKLFNTELGIQNTNFPHSLFLHPRDKVLNLTGTLVKEDYEKIKEQEQLFYKQSDKKLIRKKERILKILDKKLSKPKADFIGTFSNKQLQEMKNFVIQYEALTNCLKKQKLYNKIDETIYYKTKLPSEINIGNYVNGLGLVINRFNIIKTNGKEVPAIVIFSNKNAFNTFRMYDLRALEALKNPEEEKNALISEVEFKRTPNNTYFVRNFRNYNTKKYPNGGKIIGLQLMKLLAEKKCKPIELSALAYGGSKHSPVNFYRYFGFKPVSHSEEEINRLMNENNGVFPCDIPVKMCMDDLAEIEQRIKLLEKAFYK